MFTTQKMLLIDLLVLEKDVDNISKILVEFGQFELSSHSSLTFSDKWHIQPIHQKKRMISDLQQEAKELQEFYLQHASQIPMFFEENSEDLGLPAITEFIRTYKREKLNFLEQYNAIRKNKEWYAVKMAGLRMYNEATSKMKHHEIHAITHFYSILGTISTANLPLLQHEFENNFEGELLYEGHVNESEIVFIAVSHQQVKELTAILDNLYFINHGLPSEFFGEGDTNMLHLSLEYTLLCDQEDILQQKIITTSYHVLQKLYTIINSLNFYQQIDSVQNQIKHTDLFATLSGWITEKSYPAIQKLLKQKCGDNFEIIVSDVDTFTQPADPPTKLNNPKIFKPFETLVTLFGVPNYKELDPTIIFGILYVIMYGAMFGDVLQGLALFLTGFAGFLFSKKKKNSNNMIFSLMMWVGTSSSIFGLLYGSYFGYESAGGYNVPHPLWMSPIHNINSILSIAVLFGITLITLSYILGIINAFRMKNWAGLIFSHKGLTAFTVYILLLVIAYYTYTQQSAPFIITLIIVILSVFLGLERVWEALIYKHGSLKDWWMGFFDMFEFYLSMLTNTLSFVRIGAFALTHAALMMAIFTLRDLAGGTGLAANLVVFIGNIFVICMEGFIVGIQTLRLEYYEFFLRFFQGTGREFNPIKSKIKDSR